MSDAEVIAYSAMAEAYINALQAMARCIRIAADRGLYSAIEFLLDFLSEADAYQDSDGEAWEAYLRRIQDGEPPSEDARKILAAIEAGEEDSE